MNSKKKMGDFMKPEDRTLTALIKMFYAEENKHKKIFIFHRIDEEFKRVKKLLESQLES